VGRCRMLGTRTGEGTRSHAPFHRGQLRAGLQRRARPRRQAPAHATSAACPGPAPEAADRRRGETPRPPAPACGPSRAPQRPHRPSSLHPERTEPVATHHPTAVTGDLDDHTLLPVGHDRVLPQPALHRGITAFEDRPVMSARIDPLDPDSIHNPQSSSPPALPIRSLLPARPIPMTRGEGSDGLHSAGVLMVLHFAHQDVLDPVIALSCRCACVESRRCNHVHMTGRGTAPRMEVRHFWDQMSSPWDSLLGISPRSSGKRRCILRRSECPEPS
jgi:hypothetical protein